VTQNPTTAAAAAAAVVQAATHPAVSVLQAPTQQHMPAPVPSTGPLPDPVAMNSTPSPVAEDVDMTAADSSTGGVAAAIILHTPREPVSWAASVGGRETRVWECRRSVSPWWAAAADGE
jgi:hypothetical protein